MMSTQEDQNALTKCAVALGLPMEALGHHVNLVVNATNEPLEPRQLIQVDKRRLMVVCSLTREEFDAVRRFNAAIREHYKRPRLVWSASGERADLLTSTPDPGEPPEWCAHYYLLKPLDR